ncbi:MAG TPA: ferrous iron transport protein B [Anaerolineaceae bacterium]
MSTFSPAQIPSKQQKQKEFTIALAGQPNMGKSTLFNLLTGLNQHVGNWTGKTIEKREGTFVYKDHHIHLIDLPGTYGLSANSPEELLARDFILQEHPDLVIAVVSAVNLERSLYLVSELVLLPTPVIIALNMMDVAQQEKIEIDVPVLQAAIGLPVIPIIATRASGVEELLVSMNAIFDGKLNPAPRIPKIRPDHQEIQCQIKSLIAGFIPKVYPLNWCALKVLEGDVEVTQKIRETLPIESWEMVATILKAHDDAFLAIVSGRYAWIEDLIRKCVRKPPIGQIGLTDRLDRWATHPVYGIIILAAILGMIFGLTFSIGTPIQEWLETALITPFSSIVSSWLSASPPWLASFVVNGLIGGVGSVLTFLPIIMIFFAVFGILEDVGYMARAAFVMDNFMHMMGLHGKSFLPLFLGFGCNVPAVMGTRVIETWSARVLTIILAPFIPCTARMAVLAFLAPAFFGSQAILVTWGLILFSLIMLIMTGVLLNRIIFKGERTAFVMELPLYHRPNLRSTGLMVGQRLLAFVKKAGTVILAFSAVIWCLSFFPGASLDQSFLAQIGGFLEPVGRWMGFDWRLTVALLTSFMAKENAIATLGILFGNTSDMGLSNSLIAAYSPAVALSYMTASLLFIPCAATVAVIRQESGSWRWTFLNIGLMLVLSIALAGSINLIASAIGL